jgi:hypothetical protein
MYSYRKSIKSSKSDELINTYLLRPVAGLFVWAFYYTPITPNQVTIVSTLSGFIAAWYYLQGTPHDFIVAGLLVTLKDILDSADGQLARAKEQFSRIGRFLDSIGDVLVDIAVFSAIGWSLFRLSGQWSDILLAFIGFAGITLRVSYHVFYHVSYLHLQDQYTNNRIIEEVRDEDILQGGIELGLQRVFQIIYGWQDRFMMRIDRWCMGENRERILKTSELNKSWYEHSTGLRISGFLGFGTELFLLMICSVYNELRFYLLLNLFLMNGILIVSILYRRYSASGLVETPGRK